MQAMMKLIVLCMYFMVPIIATQDSCSPCATFHCYGDGACLLSIDVPGQTLKTVCDVNPQVFKNAKDCVRHPDYFYSHWCGDCTHPRPSQSPSVSPTRFGETRTPSLSSPTMKPSIFQTMKPSLSQTMKPSLSQTNKTSLSQSDKPSQSPTRTGAVEVVVEVQGVDETNKDTVCDGFAEAVNGTTEYCSLSGPNTKRRRLTTKLYMDISVLDATKAVATMEKENFVETVSLPSEVKVTTVTAKKATPVVKVCPPNTIKKSGDCYCKHDRTLLASDNNCPTSVPTTSATTQQSVDVCFMAVLFLLGLFNLE